MYYGSTSSNPPALISEWLFFRCNDSFWPVLGRAKDCGRTGSEFWGHQSSRRNQSNEWLGYVDTVYCDWGHFQRGKHIDSCIDQWDSHCHSLGMERMSCALLIEGWSVHYLSQVCVCLTLFRFEVEHFAGWEDGHGRVFWRDWQPPETGQCLHFPCDRVAGQRDPPGVRRHLLSVQVSRPFALPTPLSARCRPLCSVDCFTFVRLWHSWEMTTTGLWNKMLSSHKMGVRTRNLQWNETEFIVGRDVAMPPAKRFYCGPSLSARNIGSDPDTPIY